jgi:hypothetical protein
MKDPLQEVPIQGGAQAGAAFVGHFGKEAFVEKTAKFISVFEVDDMLFAFAYH